ncbi:hypothetical protein, partial [Geobacter anodireducens]
AAPGRLSSFSIDDLLEHVDLPHFRVQENRGRHSFCFILSIIEVNGSGKSSYFERLGKWY